MNAFFFPPDERYTFGFGVDAVFDEFGNGFKRIALGEGDDADGVPVVADAELAGILVFSTLGFGFQRIGCNAPVLGMEEMFFNLDVLSQVRQATNSLDSAGCFQEQIQSSFTLPYGPQRRWIRACRAADILTWPKLRSTWEGHSATVSPLHDACEACALPLHGVCPSWTRSSAVGCDDHYHQHASGDFVHGEPVGSGQRRDFGLGQRAIPAIHR